MSPIKGLTDDVAPRFPRLGKLRKGGPSVEKVNKDGRKYNSYGPELEYFRFTATPEVEAAFQAAYGEQPALIHVYLPYDSVDENFATWREEWSGGGLVHRCDGQTMTIWRTADGKYSQQAKPCDGTKCKPVGRLEVIIPELWGAGFVGHVTLETHSLHDLRNITAALLATAQAGRGLRGIQFNLRRVKAQISTPAGNGQRATREKWLVSLEPNPDWVQLQLQAARERQGLPLLPAPVSIVDQATGEVIDADAPEDGDFDEDESPAPRTTAAPPPTAPKAGNGRPYSADAVKAAIEEYIINHPTDDPPSEKRLILYRSLISKLIPDAQRRHTLQYELTGVQSSADMKAGQVGGILGWLKPTGPDDNGRWAIGNEYALAEANSVINTAVTREAVGELPGMPEAEGIPL